MPKGLKKEVLFLDLEKEGFLDTCTVWLEYGPEFACSLVCP